MKNSRPIASSPFLVDLDHEYLIHRRTKIVATIGPSSSSPRMIAQLVKKGLNVFRINFSHGNPRDHLKVIAAIRRAAQKQGVSVAILGDLCGPKIRVGRFVNDAITLKEKSTVVITTDDVLGREGLIPSQYKRLAQEASLGARILLDDGNLELEVTRKLAANRLEAKVVRGGVLKNNKGMNLPDTTMRISALTAKDKNDALYCIRGKVDYIALSFVRKPHDILDLKRFLHAHGADIPVIAKIEKPEALQHIDKIIELADGIMIARGDLGVELPAKKVPFIQNKLIELTNAACKPVIVATQMLESMIEHSRPTRAEVTDVAGACLAGADAVMLSGETAAGKYPLEAFDTMDSICREAEAYQFFAYSGRFHDPSPSSNTDLQEALGLASAQLSRDLRVRCIFVLTRSGLTARMVAADRPAAPVIALTQSRQVQARLNLIWGVYAHHVNKELTFAEYVAYGESIIKKKRLGKKGDNLIMLAGIGDKNEATNAVVVHKVG